MSAAPTESDYRKLLTHAMAILARAGRIHGETGHMSLVMTSIPNAEDLVGILHIAGCSDITVTVHGFDLIPNPGNAHTGIPVSKIDKGRVYDLDGNEVQGTETLTVRWGEPVEVSGG